MWPRRVYKIVRGKVWERAQERGYLKGRRMFLGVIPCYSATAIAKQLTQAFPGTVLLCIDPRETGGRKSLEGDHIVVREALAVEAVDAAHALPADVCGDSGLPLAEEPFYLGQVVRDVAVQAPSVPNAGKIEAMVGDILDMHARNPDTPLADVAQTVVELQTRRLPYEKLSPALFDRVNAWMDAQWTASDVVDYPTMCMLAANNEPLPCPRFIERLTRDLRHDDERIRAIAAKRLHETRERIATLTD